MERTSINIMADKYSLNKDKDKNKENNKNIEKNISLNIEDKNNFNYKLINMFNYYLLNIVIELNDSLECNFTVEDFQLESRLIAYIECKKFLELSQQNNINIYKYSSLDLAQDFYNFRNYIYPSFYENQTYDILDIYLFDNITQKIGHNNIYINKNNKICFTNL